MTERPRAVCLAGEEARASKAPVKDGPGREGKSRTREFKGAIRSVKATAKLAKIAELKNQQREGRA